MNMEDKESKFNRKKTYSTNNQNITHMSLTLYFILKSFFEYGVIFVNILVLRAVKSQ